MILDQDGIIIKMNKKQEATSQINREKVLGRAFHDAYPKVLEQGVKKYYDKLLKTGKPYDIIVDRYTPQFYSKQKTFHTRGAAFSSGKYFILLHDLEEELYYVKRLVERKTKQLHESKKFLESLIDSSPSILISTDLTDKIISFNKTAEGSFGYKEQEVKKKEIQILFEDPFPEEGMDSSNALIPKEMLCLRKDQTTFPTSLLTTDIKNAAKKTIAKLYVLSDLTELKAMEERLLLSEKLALYTELMGGIAHQLNNPLIGVVNFSEMLLQEMEEHDPKRKMAETISLAGKECLKISTSIMNCIKDPHLTFTKIDIHEILADALRTLQAQFPYEIKRITAEMDLDPRMGPIQGDGIQLKQCFLNIMTNAVQAMQDQNGALKITSEFEKEKQEIRLRFADTGPGIPKEFLSKIFLPFVSLHKTKGCHGLGLSFAYQIIKNHNGYIEVDSSLGKGTTFTLVLPLNTRPAEGLP
jgi:PAS domain S-box-containing protein